MKKLLFGLTILLASVFSVNAQTAKIVRADSTLVNRHLYVIGVLTADTINGNIRLTGPLDVNGLSTLDSVNIGTLLTGSAGGWTYFTKRIYQTTAGDSVFIRTAAADTTVVGGALFNVIGTAYVSGTLKVGGVLTANGSGLTIIPIAGTTGLQDSLNNKQNRGEGYVIGAATATTLTPSGTSGQFGWRTRNPTAPQSGTLLPATNTDTSFVNYLKSTGYISFTSAIGTAADVWIRRVNPGRVVLGTNATDSAGALSLGRIELNGNIILPNNTAYQSKKFDGTAQGILILDASNHLSLTSPGASYYNAAGFVGTAAHIFRNSGSITWMVIDYDGNVGKGTITPRHVSSSASSFATNLNAFNFYNSNRNLNVTTAAQERDTSSIAAWFSGAGTPTFRIVNSLGATQFQSDSMGITVGTVVRDTTSFVTTATRTAVYIAGATSTDQYVASPRVVDAEILPTSNDVILAYAKADSVIFTRPASGTSGLKLSFIRIK